MNIGLTETFLPLPNVLYLHSYYGCALDKDEAPYLVTKRDDVVPHEDHKAHEAHVLHESDRQTPADPERGDCHTIVTRLTQVSLAHALKREKTTHVCATSWTYVTIASTGAAAVHAPSYTQQ